MSRPNAYPVNPAFGPQPEQQAEEACRRRMLRLEFYALAVLVGLQLSVVYVIGTLIVNCVSQ